MRPLARGPGEAGDRQQANASKKPTPFGGLIVDLAGGDGMRPLARGPGDAADRQQANAGKEPTPFGPLTAGSEGGDA